MLYSDFFFRMAQGKAICITGWTMGPVGQPALIGGDRSLPAAAVLLHRRADLPPGANGFILRFDLDGDAPDLETARLQLETPARSAALPASTAQLEALIKTAPDELVLCLLIGMVEGVFAVDDAGAMIALHKRSVAMAAKWGLAELPEAAVAQDLSMSFAAPGRVVVTGWMADDGQGDPFRPLGAVLDAQGIQALPVHADALIRPDLSGARIRSLRVSAASGYVGLAQVTQPLGANPVSVVGMVKNGQALCTLRPFVNLMAGELGPQYQTLRRNLIQSDRADQTLRPMLPSLPHHDAQAEAPAQSPASGLAFVVDHDLDPALGRDLARFVRKRAAGVTALRLLVDGPSPALAQAIQADRTESGNRGLEIDAMVTNMPLATWAPKARHLAFASASVLFQTLPLADMAAARRAGVALWCLILTDRIEPGRGPLTAAQAIAALTAGAPFVAQIGQSRVGLTVQPESLHLSPANQMRWLVALLARRADARFVTESALGHMPGRDSLAPMASLIELKAMRQTLSEIPA